MSDNEQIDAKLESMLRQWGAQEAVARAARGDTPALPVAPLKRARWAPVLAAAAVVLAAGAAAVTLIQRQVDLKTAADDRRRLEDSMAELRVHLASEIEAARNSQTQKLNELGLSKVGSEKLWSDKAAKYEQAMTALTEELAQKDIELKKAQAELAPAKQSLALAARRLGDANVELDKNRKELAMVRDEFARLRKLYQESLLAPASRPGVTADDATIRLATAWSEFSDAYFAATAPGETGFRSVQVSVQRSKMVDRCNKLRQDAKTEASRKLLDKIETVLTRLQLVEVGNFEAEGAFRSLINSSDVLKQIETALDANPEPAVKAFLIEARIVFTGALRVG